MEPTAEFPSARPSPVWRLLLAAALLVSLVQSVTLLHGGRVHNNDFKHLWAGSRLLAEGADPYDPVVMMLAARENGFDRVNPFVYPPATGLLVRPFTMLPFGPASAAWFWFNFVLAWCCAMLGPVWLRVERPALAQCAGAAFIIGSLPFYRQMTAGQMNVCVLAMLIAALGFLIRGRPWIAGGILGVAAAFKIAPAFLLLVLAGMKRGRAAAAGFAALFLVSGLAELWAGWEVHSASWGVLKRMGYGASTWEEYGNDFYRNPFNQSFNSLFHHLFADNPYTLPWMDLGSRTANLLTYCVAGLLLLWLASALIQYRRRPCFRRDWGEVESLLYLLGVLGMLLLPSLMWDHYAVQSMIVLAWLFGSRRILFRPIDLSLALAAFFLLAYPVFHTAEEWSGGLGILMMSIRLWGTLALLVLLRSGLRREFKERAQQARTGLDAGGPAAPPIQFN